MNYKIFGTSLSAAILFAVIIFACFQISNSIVDTYTNLSIVALGCSIGWILGIAVSPYTNSEEKRFSLFAQAIGLFVSGYVVGKMDKLIDHVFDPMFIFDQLVGFRIIALLTAIITSLIVTFVYRAYAPG